MIVKAFEIRDRGTFIPALAVLMRPRHVANLGFITPADRDQHEAERYLLRRAGYNIEDPSECCVILCRMEAAGTAHNATYDPYSWGQGTMNQAHMYIADHWSDLQSGQVIDVEFIRGVTAKPKVSERLTDNH